MKKSLNIIAYIFMLFSSLTNAANPVDGGYFGFILGGNFAPSVNVEYPFGNYILLPYQPLGTLSYDFGGNIGAALGYKYCNFRVEAEFDYAYLGYDKLQLGNRVLRNKRSATELKFGGNTTMMSGFINGYYNIFTPDAEMNFMPYVGLGLGMVNLRNTANLSLDGRVLAKTVHTKSSSAAQGIFGIGYYLDDFTTIALDYRYLITNNMNTGDFFLTRFKVSSLNLNFNFSFG